MTAFPFKDQRKFPRITSFHLIRSEGLETPSESQVSNLVELSEGGLQFTSSRTLEPSDKLRITINLRESGRDISVIGKVVWVRPVVDQGKITLFRVGVSFTEISEEDLKLIRKFVKNFRQ